MHQYRSLRFLRRMAHVLRLLGFLDAAVSDGAARIIVIERLQGLVHGDMGQEGRFVPVAILVTVPCADDHRMDGVGLEVTVVPDSSGPR
jgi:hypothetical protein